MLKGVHAPTRLFDYMMEILSVYALNKAPSRLSVDIFEVAEQSILLGGIKDFAIEFDTAQSFSHRSWDCRLDELDILHDPPKTLNLGLGNVVVLANGFQDVLGSSIFNSGSSIIASAAALYIYM